MTNILCIETATEICSVSLIQENDLIMYKELDETNAHSRFLTVLVEEIFKESGIGAKDLSAVALSQGPGSYTGLRIGASVAKGLCYAGGTKLISIDTLEIIARGLPAEQIDQGEVVIPMLDARRMEVYCAVYSNAFDLLKNAEPHILQKDSFEEYLDNKVVHFIGNGSGKFQTLCDHRNARFHIDIRLTARSMTTPVVNAFKSGHFTDYVYFEPSYLKPVMATKPKKKWF